MINVAKVMGEDSICQGCKKSPGRVLTGWQCSVYANPQKVHSYHTGECAFNTKFKGRGEQRKINPIISSKRGQG